MVKRSIQWLAIPVFSLLLSNCAPQPSVPSTQVPPQQTVGQQYAYPDTPIPRYQQGAVPNAQMSQLSSGGVKKIGLLLPLTGRSSVLGKALQDAAILALFDKYATLPANAAVTRVELVPKDTGGTPEGARKAARAAIAEGAELFIGPLFASSVEAVAPIARSKGMNVISFSNSKAVAAPGVFLFGFDPAEQVERVASYAYLRDVFRVALFAPNSVYGQSVADALEHTAAPYGRPVEPISYYAASGETINSDVDAFAEKGIKNGRVSFSALMLPESGDKLRTILNAFSARGVRSGIVRFLGTGVWDDAVLRKSVNLTGGWYASAPPRHYNAFEGRFLAAYGYQPLRIASLAYDAVALASTLAIQGNFSAASLTNPNGYSGPANGVFRFRRDGTAERALAVLEILPGGDVKVVDSAPTSFVK